MTPRRRRMVLVGGIVAGVGLAVALALLAFRQNVTFFFVPSQVLAKNVRVGEHFRLGGMVTKGSIRRVPGSLEIHFSVTDYKHTIPVVYTGVLPDLFRQGQGVIAQGHMNSRGVFVADQVLAKHDEKYMPPQMAKAIEAENGGVMPFGTTGDALHTPVYRSPTALSEAQTEQAARALQGGALPAQASLPTQASPPAQALIPAQPPLRGSPPQASTRSPGGLR